MKKIIIFLSLFVIQGASYCQSITCCPSIIGIGGGYTKTNFVLENKDTRVDSLRYTKYNDTYNLSLFYKGRALKHLHYAFKLTYTKVNFHFHGIGYNLGHFPQAPLYPVRDVIFDVRYLHAALFPEISFGKKWMVTLGGGPVFVFPVYSQITGYDYDLASKYYEIENSKAFFGGYNMRIFGSIGVEAPINDKFKINLESSFSDFEFYDIGVGHSSATFNQQIFTFSMGLCYNLSHFNIIPPPR